MDSEIKVISVKRVAGRRNRQTRIATDLSDAIAQHHIMVHFQPQYELRGGRCCGVEALARWMQLNGVETPPALFIPVAERFGMIGAIGVSVLYQSCVTLLDWSEFSARPPTLSVNVSAQQLTPDFGAVIGSVIELTGFPGSQLELEITETTLIANMERAVRCLDACRGLGVKVALDDFGTGYSSLQYLAKLPVDRVKLDRYFVERVCDRKAAAIVRSMVALCAEMGVEVIAEGIESERQLAVLESLGCAQGQGNLFAKSLPTEQARLLMQRPWGSRFAAATCNHPDGGGLHAA
jgi:EAL domain-containing protein (putative c-di-GMP-specific phosphodiesterase class I)